MHPRNKAIMVVVAVVALIGTVGGLQSGAPASEWGWFVFGVVLIGLIALGIFGSEHE